MAVKFKVVKRKVLNGAEKDSVKNYAIAKTSGTSDLNKLCKLICSLHAFVGGRESGARFIKLGDGSGTFLRQRGAIGRIWKLPYVY